MVQNLIRLLLRGSINQFIFRIDVALHKLDWRRTLLDTTQFDFTSLATEVVLSRNLRVTT